MNYQEEMALRIKIAGLQIAQRTLKKLERGEIAKSKEDRRQKHLPESDIAATGQESCKFLLMGATTGNPQLKSICTIHLYLAEDNPSH